MKEVKTNQALWTHDNGETEIRAIRNLLRRDFDGEYFVDYLRVLEGELDELDDYPRLLELHNEFIEQGLKRYKGKASVLTKYKWLREYHRHTVKEWKEQNRR